MNSVNLIGWPDVTAGMGEHMRSVAGALAAGGIRMAVHDVLEQCFNDPSIFNREEKALRPYTKELPLEHPVSIHCLNLNHLPRISSEYFGASYNIGYGYYEMSDVLDDFLRGAELLDEIWAPTKFVQATISRRVTIPVVYMPIPLEVPGKRQDIRSKFGLSGRDFTFYCSFDARSLIERKNPFAVIDAFKRAFARVDAPVVLLIKVSASPNSKPQLKAVGELKRKIEGDPRIRLLRPVLGREELMDLFYSVDCYVSLHRAEGLGLGMSEAMSVGTPVIATGYSGNLDFMDASNSSLVGFDYVNDDTPQKIDRNIKLSERFYWADANVDDAAEKMRRIFTDPAYRLRIAAKGKSDVARFYSVEAIARNYSERLELLGSKLGIKND